MNKQRKKIQKKWMHNFVSSKLVKDGDLNRDLAKRIFHGGDFTGDLAQFNMGLRHFANRWSDSEEFKIKLLSFLSLVGVELGLDNLNYAIAEKHIEFKEFVKRIILLFRTFSNANSKFSIYDPYSNNYAEINLLLDIETRIFNKNKDLFDSQHAVYNEYIKLPKDYVHDEFSEKLYNTIENTNKSFFITGKAGTGKSTFIHYFTKNTKKNVLLLSFTGIAAVNIGGQTIHSFFGFPHRPMVINDKEIKLFKFSYPPKYELIKNVDTIIIDEVSMLRSDIIESIHWSLIKNGGNPDLPFGGKQILLVGDSFQLPPVLETNDLTKYIFTKMYPSQYFFDSPSFKKLNPERVELTTIHRQKDLKFISLLNKVRDYSIIQSQLDNINSRCVVQDLEHNDLEIKLTTHRYLADKENMRRLDLLKYDEFTFNADIYGVFPDDKRPAPEILKLKRNAQIMFVKNDSSKKWVNGTLAKIHFIADDYIEVKMKGGQIYKVEKVEWENKKCKWDKKTESVVSENIGTFKQYPIKLAWAITIHKSQGLTFDKVRINLGQGTFVPGQLYTSLSRCRTFEGLGLDRPIQLSDVIIDKRVKDFEKLVDYEQVLV